MRPTIYNHFLRKSFTLLLIFLTGFNSFAQEKPKRLSAGIILGMPATFFSIKSKPVGIFTATLRYSINKNWSIESKLTSCTFNNTTGNPAKTTLDGSITDIASYRTPVYGLNGVVYYNFGKLLKLDKKMDNRWLPFANFGAGLNMYKPSKGMVNGITVVNEKFGKPYRDYQIGIGTRYFVNSTIDLVGGIEYHISETYYLDGFKEPSKAKLDQFLNPYAGINIKLGASPSNNLIEWTNKNVDKDIEKIKDYAHWALDGNMGVPYMFTPIGYKFSGMAKVGIRRSFNRILGFQLNFSQGQIAGNQTISGTPVPGSADYIQDYTTTIKQFTVRTYLNLTNFKAESQVRAKWNHYALIGVGYMLAKGGATFANQTVNSDMKLYKNPGVQNIVLGYEARRYLNHKFDWILGLDFNYNQSKWLDQAYTDNKLDNHLFFHTGLTYKIATSVNKEHVDWAYGTYNNYRDVKKVIEQQMVIEKPMISEPIIDTAKTVVSKPAEPAPAAPPVIAEPVPVPAPVVPPAPPVKPEEKPVVKPAPEPKPIVKPEPKPEPKPEVKPTPKPVKPAPKPAVKPAEKPVPSKNVQTPVEVQKPVEEAAPIVEPKADVQVIGGEFGAPQAKYNVIVACYSVRKANVANKYLDKLTQKGYSPVIYRSSNRSQLLRMAIISTNDKKEALKTLRMARKEIEPTSWLYLYNKQ